MNRKEYADQVMASLRWTTQKEEAVIRAELDGHIEDHICDLMDLGYSEELAEERTMLRMGDPEEVGRELDKQYPMRWLVIGDIAAFVAGVLIFLFIIVQAAELYEESVLQAVYYRFFPEPLECLTEEEVVRETDIRFDLNDDVLRIFQVSVGEKENQRVAAVDIQCFDRLPGGTVGRWMNWVVVENQRGEKGRETANPESWIRSRKYGSRWLRQECFWVPIGTDDSYVTLRCGGFGQEVEYQIPLPKEVVP